MQNFFINPEQINGNMVSVIGDDVNHIANAQPLGTYCFGLKT